MANNGTSRTVLRPYQAAAATQETYINLAWDLVERSRRRWEVVLALAGESFESYTRSLAATVPSPPRETRAYGRRNKNRTPLTERFDRGLV